MSPAEFHEMMYNAIPEDLSAIFPRNLGPQVFRDGVIQLVPGSVTWVPGSVTSGNAANIVDWPPWGDQTQGAQEFEEQREDWRQRQERQDQDMQTHVQRVLEQERAEQQANVLTLVQHMLEQQTNRCLAGFHVWNITTLSCEKCGVTREQFLNREEAKKGPGAFPADPKPARPLPFRRIEMPEPTPAQENT